MQKRNDDHLPLFVKIETTLCRKAITVILLLVILSLVSVFFAMRTVGSSSAERMALEKALMEQSRYAVLMTPDGRLMTAEKIPIPAQILGAYVLNSVSNYFVLDRSAFYKDDQFIEADPNNPMEFILTLIKNSYKIKDLSAFFSEKDRESVRTFYIYLKYLYGAARSGILPDSISIDGSTPPQIKFETKGNRFRAKLAIPVVYSWLGVDRKYHKGKGKIFYQIEGLFLPQKSTPVNPYGMIVEKMTVKYVEVH